MLREVVDVVPLAGDALVGETDRLAELLHVHVHRVQNRLGVAPVEDARLVAAQHEALELHHYVHALAQGHDPFHGFLVERLLSADSPGDGLVARDLRLEDVPRDLCLGNLAVAAEELDQVLLRPDVRAHEACEHRDEVQVVCQLEGQVLVLQHGTDGEVQPVELHDPHQAEHPEDAGDAQQPALVPEVRALLGVLHRGLGLEVCLNKRCQDQAEHSEHDQGEVKETPLLEVGQAFAHEFQEEFHGEDRQENDLQHVETAIVARDAVLELRDDGGAYDADHHEGVERQRLEERVQHAHLPRARRLLLRLVLVRLLALVHELADDAEVAEVVGRLALRQRDAEQQQLCIPHAGE
mmetsp:Transcript_47971/g.120919  ORF Transcript_47971/g.120919 Transcript_47971/m.120919 type:complete len:352 (-) Transcript_47971:638-1693(-)